MPPRVSSVVKLNRKALSDIREAEVRALEEMGQRVIDVADPPDATPFGEGLVTTGNYGVWADGKKVAGELRKPKRLNIKQGVTLIVGYGFPGRFQELGTVKMAANPFLTPAMLEVVPKAPSFLQRLMGRIR